MDRREILKQLTVLPFAGSFLPFDTVLNTSRGPVAYGPGVYQSIGVEPFINCRGTFTIIGGSLERPAVRVAKEAATYNFVHIDELADAVGKRLAELTGAEWGMISAGCAAGLKHVTAACVTGGDPEKLIRIPDLTGLLRTEVIIPTYARNSYDHAIRNIGVRIINVTSPEELKNAINPKTAMIELTTGSSSETGKPFSLEVIAEIAKSKNIPVLVDAAAENLTIPPIHLKRGATIVAYSGGKAICGPQSAGLLLGNKEILKSAWQASSPHHGPGRDNKVNKDEMVAMLAAVEDWTKRDHEYEWKRWLSWLETISKKVTIIDGITTRIVEPTGLNNKSPVLHIIWDPKMLHITGDEVVTEVGWSKPRIALGYRDDSDGNTSISITTGQMQPGEEKIVADRLYNILSQKRNPKPLMMTPPSFNISGQWDVEVKYYSSICKYTFNLEQDENWIQGTHKGDLSIRDIVGTIEGEKVTLLSSISIIADNIKQIFSGTVLNNSMIGDLHMGEYGTVKFTATKKSSNPHRQKLIIPGGPIKVSSWPLSL
jgi:seryl-tRNA(Sec) selenium transferase